MKNYFLGISIIVCTCLYIYSNRFHFEKVLVNGYGGFDGVTEHEAILRLDRLNGTACTIQSFSINGYKAIQLEYLPTKC